MQPHRLRKDGNRPHGSAGGHVRHAGLPARPAVPPGRNNPVITESGATGLWPGPASPATGIQRQRKFHPVRVHRTTPLLSQQYVPCPARLSNSVWPPPDFIRLLYSRVGWNWFARISTRRLLLIPPFPQIFKTGNIECRCHGIMRWVTDGFKYVIVYKTYDTRHSIASPYHTGVLEGIMPCSPKSEFEEDQSCLPSVRAAISRASHHSQMQNNRFLKRLITNGHEL